MIALDKDSKAKKYNFLCRNCEEEIQFASNQPPGENEIVYGICLCYHPYKLRLIGEKRKGQRRMEKPTSELHKQIVNVYAKEQIHMSLRQVYYQLVNNKVVGKDKTGEGQVQRQLLMMRRHGLIPHEFVPDLSRGFYKPDSFNGAKDALSRWVKSYKQDVWINTDIHVEIWLEKRALAGIFSEITREWDTHLFVSAGFASEGFLTEAKLEIERIDKPTSIYFFSDFDQYGMNLSESVEKGLKRMGLNVHFERVGLNKTQIDWYQISMRETKPKVTKDGKLIPIPEMFKDGSAELDALPPKILQGMIEGCITNHMSLHDLEMIKMEEEVQRESLEKVLKRMKATM